LKLLIGLGLDELIHATNLSNFDAKSRLYDSVISH